MTETSDNVTGIGGRLCSICTAPVRVGDRIVHDREQAFCHYGCWLDYNTERATLEQRETR